MEYNILGLTEEGETKFLSKLFCDWKEVKNRRECPIFTKDQLDYLIPLLESENDGFLHIRYFPSHIKWEDEDGKLY